MNEPNFEALRMKRNEEFDAYIAKMKAEGFEVSRCALHDKNACYCGCPDGPCEHDWTGPTVEVGEGGWSVTCARCGLDAMGHSMRFF